MLRDAMILLGLPPDEPATPEQTKRAYLRKLREHPPESDPDGFQEVRAAYDLVKDGYDAGAAAEHDDVLRTFEEYVRANRGDSDELEEAEHRVRAILDEALGHLERGDVASARTCVTGTSMGLHDRFFDDQLKAQYIGLRELVERAHKLPRTAVPAFAQALRELEEDMPSAALIEYRQNHARDARHAFQVIRGSEAGVLRAMVVLIEPNLWTDPTSRRYKIVAALFMILWIISLIA